MPRSFYEGVAGIADSEGIFSVLSGVNVYLYDRGTTDLSTVYQTETETAQGPSPSAGATGTNPFTTGVSGSIQFWATAPARYDIKLVDTVVPARFTDRTIEWNAGPIDEIPSISLADDAGITDDKLATSSVTSAKIFDGTIVVDDIADGAITSAKIADGTIVLADLAAALQAFLLPTGFVGWTALADAPTGWLLCDGTACTVDRVAGNVLRTALIAASNPYGVSGSDPLLPNLKGKVPAGKDAAQTEFDVLGEAGGAKTVTLDVNQIPSHNHSGNTGSTNPRHAHSVGGGVNVYIAGVAGSMAGPGPIGYNATAVAADYTDIDHYHSVASQGGGQSHSNLQPYVTLNGIIKT